MTERQTHVATIELKEPAPADIPVGATFVARVAVRCAEGCELHAGMLHVAAPVGAGDPQQANANEESEIELTLHAPQQVGDHVWRISLPSSPTGARHDAEPLSISVSVKPQATSLAVWDIPSPVVMGETIDIKAGAKSAGDFKLNGRAIEVRDESGTVLARGSLGDAPWPGTSGLFWTQLRLSAPDREGPRTWSVRFAATDVELPHDGSVSNFTIAVTRPAEHRLTVKVTEKDTDTSKPIEDAEVRLGVYRATTNPAGIATLEVPKGSYELVVWKAGYEVPIVSTEVDADRIVEVAATVVPEDDPDAIWTV